MRAMPYFLENPEWYNEKIDDEGNTTYTLTDQAPKKAIDSYNEYYSEPEFYDENGELMDLSGYSCYA